MTLRETELLTCLRSHTWDYIDGAMTKREFLDGKRERAVLECYAAKWPDVMRDLIQEHYHTFNIEMPAWWFTHQVGILV